MALAACRIISSHVKGTINDDALDVVSVLWDDDSRSDKDFALDGAYLALNEDAGSRPHSTISAIDAMAKDDPCRYAMLFSLFAKGVRSLKEATKMSQTACPSSVSVTFSREQYFNMLFHVEACHTRH
jgi:hypothetical protein